VRATASSLLIAVLLGLSAAAETGVRQQSTRICREYLTGEIPCEEWTWKDRDGTSHSCADLDAVIEQHRRWVMTDGKSGSRADLRGADLRGADLSGTDLIDVDFSGTDLYEANLSNASLYGALLNGADLSGANLWETDLEDADLRGTKLFITRLHGVYFQPKTLPLVDRIAEAEGLEQMTYRNSPSPLTQLRKQFQDAGYREQERAITCVLNRRQAELAPAIERWFKRIAFDYTCEYGFSPGRPLLIVLGLWLLFGVIYSVFMHLPGTSGIYLIGTRTWRGKTNAQGIQIRPEPIPPAQAWKKPFLWLRREWRVLRAAMFFSLMSAFNIGFRDINFGRWIRLLTKREYDLKAVGWARTVSGFQSLLSVYLIALWVLSYFGRPFG